MGTESGAHFDLILLSTINVPSPGVYGNDGRKVLYGEAADRFLAEGAALIQIYTGMVSRGPLFGRDLARAYAWSQTEWPGKIW